MLRHTAFFLHRDTTTPEHREAMLKGLAYLRFECSSVRALDYGEDVFGGSSRLREIVPWKRTPRWRGRREGPPASFDVALHLDFDDQAGLDAYNHDDAHHRVAIYNASINVGELTARVDWWYDGAPLIRRGHIRHTAMFVWADEADEAARRHAQDAARRLKGAPGVETVTIGQNVGTLTTDYDWILDVQLTDKGATEALVANGLYAEVIREVAAATKYEWTARLSHVMRGV